MHRTGSIIRNVLVALCFVVMMTSAIAQSPEPPLTIPEQIRQAAPGYSAYETKLGWLLLAASMVGIVFGLMWYSRWNFRRRLRRLKPSAVVIAEERKARESDDAPKRVRRKEKSRQRTPKKKISAPKPRDEHSDSWSRRKWRW